MKKEYIITGGSAYHEFMQYVRTDLKNVIKECNFLKELTKNQIDDILKILNKELKTFENKIKDYVIDILEFLNKTLHLHDLEYYYNQHICYNEFGFDCAYITIRSENSYINHIGFNVRTKEFLYQDPSSIRKFITTFDSY